MTKGTKGNPDALSSDGTRVDYQNAMERDRIEQRHAIKAADTKTQSLSSGGRMNSPQLSRTDSPLAKIFLNDFISRLAQETIRYRASDIQEAGSTNVDPEPGT